MAEHNSIDNLGDMAVVIDPGSAYTKAGFSGDERPRAVVRSTAGRSAYRPDESGRVGGFRGSSAAADPPGPGAPSSHSALGDGLITDWDALEQLWSALLQEELHVCPQEHAVLATDSPLAPPAQRQRLAELLFEQFGVPALYLSHRPVLSLYSYGLVTGLLVDSGSSATRVCPVYSGYCLPHANYSMPLGGAAVSAYLRRLLGEAGSRPGGGASERRSLLREVKRQSCYVSQDFEQELRQGSEVTEYRLPDNTTVALGNERFRCAELLFCPSLDGAAQPGVHILAMSSLQSSAPEWQEELLANVVVCGGSSLLGGFPERLQAELERLAPRGSRVRVLSSSQRHFSSWLGGSIVAGLSSFQPLWVTSADYQEQGPAVVQRRFY
ncbi:actin-3-like [Clupea harengus]|uniref:Actin-3-like n=1 Tax=Clupea harengus TaxID=7950 RepID=A0A8M1KIF4_CLUHA|nr:actin-3-like [Clupea harengus]